MSIWRVSSSFVLPLILLVFVPWCIHEFLSPLTFIGIIPSLIGAIMCLIGIAILAWANTLFVVYGEGTLAPWDAPKKLVILGPYRYVRNPMSLGVITTILGQSLIFGSIYIFGWALLFWMINHIYVRSIEEAGLKRKFDDVYTRYRNAVPQWIPLFRPIQFDP